MPYLDAAIASILGQTKTDFEFCIYDDGSTDASLECARSWAARDTRIRVETGGRRLGPVGSSNAAMAMASTDLIARMDADDLAHPERLMLQYESMRRRPDIALLGSTFRIVNEAGELLSTETSDRLLATSNPLAHPTIMVRRTAFVTAGGYREGTEYFEDNDLYARMSAIGACYVLRKPLLDVRMGGQNARLQDDRAALVAQLDRFFRPHSRRDRANETHSANAVRTLAQLRVFNLQRPGLIGYMVRCGSFENLRQGLAVLGFVTLAEVSPKLTLEALRAMWHLRERQVARKLGDRKLFRWVPGMGSALIHDGASSVGQPERDCAHQGA
ncbi:glycosyltransferase family 2 protein [Blastomonas sp. SL216]|uniref:glycosyltransferase family 2 protein n=1 Tax=Blastomonas sp. SL216 TaxID=2995169 RepID=UPI002377BFA8|nr:glycosyltransferase family A protein [Blastomonas sp. SL216]